MKKISEQTNTNYDQILEELIVSCQLMGYSTKDLPLLIEEFKKNGVKLVIATNNMDCFTRWTVPALKLDMLFDDILNSYYLKAMKHDTDSNGKSLFFSEFFKKNKINPEDCIFIDDGEDKQGVIRNLGIDYRRVPADVGLRPELKTILNAFKSY